MTPMRETLRGEVLAKAGGRCQVCGYPFEAALAVHHIVPGEFGGDDEPTNLACVCENCHKLIHIMSAKAPRLPVSAREFAPYGNHRKLAALAKKARDARMALQGASLAKTRQLRALTPLEEAVATVSRLNGYVPRDAQALRDAVFGALAAIPKALRSQCSFRLASRGRVLSIAIMNYLLLRVPIGAVMTRPINPTPNCWLLWPTELRGGESFDPPGPIDFDYARCEAVLVRLSFRKASTLTRSEWSRFARGCRAAAAGQKTRLWASNIDPSAAWREQKPRKAATRARGTRAVNGSGR